MPLPGTVLGRCCLAAAAVAAAAGTSPAVSRSAASRSPANSLARAVAKAQHPHHHLSHLQQAVQDLKAAEVAAAANNPAATNRLVGAAHSQITQAIQQHKKTHLTATRTGLGGAITTVRQNTHHGHLQNAAAACKAAQKTIATGGTAVNTVKEIENAGKQVLLAVASHHRTIGK